MVRLFVSVLTFRFALDVRAAGVALCNATESCVEEQEQDEYAALHMEMLQAQTQKKHREQGASKVASTVTDAKADVVAAEKRHDSADNASEFVSFDANGKVCLLCEKPLPERVDREYNKFRTDCGEMSSSTGPNASILDMPAVQLAQINEKTKTIERNGFCQLNFAKSCADAVLNKDYLYWAKSVNLNASLARANAAWDGRYCKINGFLETSIVSLQHDFEKTQAKAQELCKTKYAKHDIQKLTFRHMAKAARYEDPTAPSVDEAELLAAWNCAMGDLGCDLALCAYSFCAKDGSTTGLYDECEGWHPIKGMPYKI